MPDAYPTFKYIAACELCGVESVWVAHVVGPDECLHPHPEEEK